MKKSSKKIVLLFAVLLVSVGAVSISATTINFGGGRTLRYTDESNKNYTGAQAKYVKKGYKLGARVRGEGSCSEDSGWAHHNNSVQSNIITCYRSGHANGWHPDTNSEYSRQ